MSESLGDYVWSASGAVINVGWTYRKAGVNLDLHHEMHSYAIESIRQLANKLGVRINEGAFTRFLDLNGFGLTLHVDGVGTKSMIAWATRRFRVLGWDCVIGNTNDIACDNAKPLAVVDYIALRDNDVDAVRGVIDGILEALNRVGAVLLGGESAIMPDLVNGIDVACAVLGIRNGPTEDVHVGDVVVGVSSGGLHMNGYTLARKVLLSRYKLDDQVCGEELADALLKPTADYGKLLLELYSSRLIRKAVHITGGAFTKLRRALGPGQGLYLEAPEPPCLFQEIQRVGGVGWGEMYRVFNMGVGLALFVNPEHVEEALKVINRWSINSWILGRVVEDEGGILRIRLWNGLEVKI
jgi:phosphoribosylformylglycinamidine cyclo-ligase